MAVTSNAYNLFKRKVLLGTAPDLTDGSLTVSLHTSTYSPDIDTDEFFTDATNEVTAGGGYTSGGQIVTTPTTGVDTSGDFGYLIADDTTFATLTKTFRYAVVRYNTGSAATSPLVWYVNFDTDQVITGVNFVIDWAAAAAGGLLKVA